MLGKIRLDELKFECNHNLTPLIKILENDNLDTCEKLIIINVIMNIICCFPKSIKNEESNEILYQFLINLHSHLTLSYEKYKPLINTEKFLMILYKDRMENEIF